jgi:hypothetical protein
MASTRNSALKWETVGTVVFAGNSNSRLSLQGRLVRPGSFLDLDKRMIFRALSLFFCRDLRLFAGYLTLQVGWITPAVMRYSNRREGYGILAKKELNRSLQNLRLSCENWSDGSVGRFAGSAY